MQSKFVPAALCALIGLAGCGRESPSSAPPAEDQPAQSVPTEDVPVTPALPSATAEVSVDDIGRWQRGMEAELKAVQDAATKLAAAKDDNAKMEAMMAATDMQTVNAGAAAAGVDVDRYRRIQDTMSNAVSQLSPIELEMDVTRMPAEMVEQMKQSRAASAAQLETQLPADLLNALKARAAALRTQEKLLVAERLKVATGAR